MLIEHVAVAEAAVVPTPYPIRLAVSKAMSPACRGSAALGPRTWRARSTSTSASNTPAFKRVRRLEFAELLEMISGKIRRVDLRQRESERHGAGASVIRAARTQ